VAAFLTELGVAFVGTGPEAAHVNTALGEKGGPVETAWVTALATPREGHVAFVVAAQPGLAVKPMTLFVNKSTIASDAHAQLTGGPAQAGVASGVLDAVADGTVASARGDELVGVVGNRAATHDALRAGSLRQPGVGDVLAVRDEPFNAYWLPESMR
jgi:5,6,7,8-tetrahydromethanopterin hydro-lyase